MIGEIDIQEPDLLNLQNGRYLEVGQGTKNDGLVILNHKSGFPYARVLEKKVHVENYDSNIYFLVRPSFPYDEVHLICASKYEALNDNDKKIVENINNEITIRQIYYSFFEKYNVSPNPNLTFRDDTMNMVQLIDRIELRQGDMIIIPPKIEVNPSEIIVNNSNPIIVNGYYGSKLVISQIPDEYIKKFWSERFIYPDYYYGAYSNGKAREGHIKYHGLIRFTK